MAWTLPEDCVLGIFGEKPELAAQGRRLAGEWGPDIAAEIHEAMLFDTLDALGLDRDPGSGWPARPGLRPDDAGPWFDERVPASFAMQPQVGRRLGQRNPGIPRGELEDGADRVVVIGSDSPSLDPTIVVSAFLCLEGRDVVLGPATERRSATSSAPGVERPPDLRRSGLEQPDVLSPVLDRLADDRAVALHLATLVHDRIAGHMRMLAGHLRALRRSGFDPGLPRLERLSRAEWVGPQG